MFKRKGQNIAEYSILIALVIAAAVAMQTYIKRGLQGRVRDTVDYAPATWEVGGEQITFDTKQYEPYYVNSTGNVMSGRSYAENIAERSQVTREDILENTVREEGAHDMQTWDDGLGYGAR